MRPIVIIIILACKALFLHFKVKNKKNVLFTQPLLNIVLCTAETATEKPGEKNPKTNRKNLSVGSQFF